MNRLYHTLIFILIASCGSDKQSEQKNSSHEQNQTYDVPVEDTIPVTEKPNSNDSLIHLDVVLNFALDYNPRLHSPKSPTLPQVTDSVFYAIEFMKTSNPTELEKYVTLIFVKLCRARLECCRMSYDQIIETKESMLVTVYKDIVKNHLAQRQTEFNASRIGYEYVREHQYLLNFKPIHEQYDHIVQLKDLE